jgi:arsenate reductase
MAEVLMNHYGQGKYRAFSAGAAPAGEINPLTIETLRSRGLRTEGLRSKSLKEFLGKKLDMVVTVCDSARESCPVWPGDTEMLHWSFDDPAGYEGNHMEKKAIFDDTLQKIETKIRVLLEGQEER